MKMTPKALSRFKFPFKTPYQCHKHKIQGFTKCYECTKDY